MSQNKFTGSALVLAAVLMGAAAYAQDAGMGGNGPMGPGMMPDFASMDADKDGKVAKAEIEAFKAARFAEADANKDGKLSVEEITAARDAMIAKRKTDRMTQMIARFDKDGDGMISAAEMPVPPNADKMFERIDTDKDGAISQAEADAAKQMMQERMGKGGRDGHGNGGHGKRGHDHGGRGGDGQSMGHGRGQGQGQGGFWGMFGDDMGPDDQGN